MGFHCNIPAPPLDALVEKIWDWDMPAPAHRYERVLPLPGAALIINLHENETRVYADDATRRCTRSAAAVLGGPMLRSQIIDTAEQIRVMGVVFQPGGVHAFTAEDIAGIAGRDVDLHDLFGVTADRLRQRLLNTQAPARRLELLERWLRQRLRVPAIDPTIRRAIEALNRVPQVNGIPLIARAIGMSDRRLTMQFSRQVGMKPKHYARLMRFRAVISHAHYQPAVNWSVVAADCGYSDQAHLSHEFRSFAGVTPSAFMAGRGPHINHLPLD
ncbi:MAG: helix-turn-helix domain-containing protein [Rhodanobacter sp.]